MARNMMYVRHVRLLSGLVLMTYVIGHLANLSIGIHSLAAMEAWRAHLMDPWRSAFGQSLLLGAACIHVALGLYAISARRSLAMSRTDVAQLILGLLTPPLLLNHVVVTYMADQVTPDFDSAYGMLLAIYWKFSPGYAFQQLFVVVIVWIHGALGLYSWLVLKPVWRRIGGLVLPLLFAVPILALVGFAESGKEVLARLATDPAWQKHITDNNGQIVKVTSRLDAMQARVLGLYGGLLLLALGVLAARMLSVRCFCQAGSVASFASTSLPDSAKPSSATIGTANSTGSTKPPMRRHTGLSTSHEYRPSAPWIHTITTTNSCWKA